MQNDSVDWILNFVGHTTGEPAAGREPGGHFDFVFNPVDRLRITQSQQRTDLRSLFTDKVERNLHPLAVGKLDLTLWNRAPSIERLQDQLPEPRLGRKNLPGHTTQQVSPRTAQEALHGSAHQHHPRVASEKHQSILQIAHDLVYIVFQGGKNLFRVAHLPSKVRDL